MKSHAQVVVIGGGVVGCSVIYHLTKLGVKDVVLIERSELTSGSTWHAAGGFHTLNADTNMAALQGYTIRLYRELEEITGQSCSLHHVGGITLAETPERFDFLKSARAMHRHMGLDTELITPEEIRQLSPITNTEGVLGGLYDPLDGHLDPSGTTHAYARAAQMQGAEIVLRNRVLETNPRADGSWEVVTEQGTIVADNLVNAGGLWAREVGALAGIYLPLHPMEHQYFATDNITRWDFGHELLDENLDRIGDSMEFAFKRFPVLADAGIKTIVNGPFTFAPDGNPLVGPVPGLRNYWSACAVMAGFSQGGGVGLTLAEWMVEGEPSRDVFAMDVARFGDYCTPSYTRLKVRENYQRRFTVSYPNEEIPAARPLETTPAYAIWQTQNAVFGEMYGMEHVNYFAPDGEEPYENPSFRRSNAFDTVAEEVRAVREGVGLNEVHNFGKYEISGEGAFEYLDTLMAGKIPALGRISLNPMLSPKGRIIGDFTIAQRAANVYQVAASFGAQAYHMRWFEQHLPATGVSLKNVSRNRIGFQIAGPKAQELLSRVTLADVSTAAMPFLSVREIDIGQCQAIVQRVSYTGDRGYEIYVPWYNQIALYDLLTEAGNDLGLRPFGMRAMMSLRLDKSFGSWMREYKPDYTPLETGLDRFVAYDKPTEFIGKAAALTEKEQGVTRKLCTFEVDARDADAVAWEPIWHAGEVVGYVTSGGYSHHARKSVAFGFLPLELVAEGREVEIEILGDMISARLYSAPLFDPDNEYLRG
jgi:dimethylglycine dehydrogenase